MTARLILRYPNSLLRTASEPVGDEDWGDRVEKWCSDIGDTMKANVGMSLAAPQVGIHKRIFGVNVKDLDSPEVFQQNPRDGVIFFINPEVTLVSGESAKSMESCLSVPSFMYSVKRSAVIDLAYTAPDKRRIVVRVEGEDAVVIQHEAEHLDGKLFTDRLNPFDRKDFLKEFEKPKREKTEGELKHLREQKRAQARNKRKK